MDRSACMTHFTFFYVVMSFNLLYYILFLLSLKTHPLFPTNHTDGSGSKKKKVVVVGEPPMDEGDELRENSYQVHKSYV